MAELVKLELSKLSDKNEEFNNEVKSTGLIL